jgi:hypothetical protein
MPRWFTCNFGNSVDEVVEPKPLKPLKPPKTSAQIISEANCKCYDIKDENGKITGKTCTKMIEVDGKIVTRKCCDEKITLETLNDGKVICVKKTPPLPSIKMLGSQQERPNKGQKIMKNPPAKKQPVKKPSVKNSPVKKIPVKKPPVINS